MKLRDYIIRRIFLFIPVMFGVVTGTFFLAHVIPADAARAWAGPFAFQEQIDQIRITYGLNDPLHIQYLNYKILALASTNPLREADLTRY